MGIVTRWIFILHRWAGIVLCLPMLMWCLSGMVMMYVSYPLLPQAERMAGLTPLDWRGCCHLPSAMPAHLGIGMLHGRPVLFGGRAPWDLRTG